MLGALLEKSDVPYLIFERASAVKPLGMSSCCCCSPSRIPLAYIQGSFFLMGTMPLHLYVIRLRDVDWTHAPSHL